MEITENPRTAWHQPRVAINSQTGFAFAKDLIYLIFAYYVVRSLYLLYWSPLAKYPGPRLCAISRLPWVWYEVSGGMAKWIHNLHLIHGDIVRVAPDELSFAKGAAWNDIYGPPTEDRKATEKEARHYVAPGGGSNSSIVGASNTDHPRLRRALLHPFSERALNETEPLIRRHLETLVNILQAAPPMDKFDMVTMYNHAAFDIMSDYAFDEPLQMQTTSQNHSWVDTTFGALWEVSLLRMAFYYPWTSVIVPLFVPRSLQSSFEKNYQHCVEKVNKSLAVGPSPTGLLGRIMGLKEELRLTPSELHVNLQTLMVAGTETSAALLSSVTYYLLRNPLAMRRLQKELRFNFHTAVDISQTALKQMPYLHGCIEETLRLQPPVPLGVPRAIPKGGGVICGEVLPEKVATFVPMHIYQYRTDHNGLKTVIYVSPIAIGRHPSRFKDCESFIPERWLGGNEYAAEDKSALQPFSFGPRNCLGKSFAYHKARMTLAMVFWHFDLSLCEESIDWAENLRLWSVWERQPLMVKVKTRPM
ncbi:hypothetical protein N7471_007059 [Penicillium samsonianum]|uniref:uncharacterized protein n=1 Tax=Penicillium samsonianum TaxID=1882272 RepID=UPI002549BB75|nr:uncharacterized protein N7471_007059 [Penicillium samsonianum]KAJ6131844.1 hypothetical protein N7471_007059 [Penicillium samsonianum]